MVRDHQRMWLHSHGEEGAGELLRSLPSHLAWHLTSGCSGGIVSSCNECTVHCFGKKSLAEYTVSVFSVNECVLFPSNCHCVCAHGEVDVLYVSELLHHNREI